MKRFSAGLVIFLLLGVPAARACNIPVFRYALERWRPDPYEMVVIHKEPLNPQDKALVDSFRTYADGPKCISNFAVETVDLTKASAKDQEKLFKTYKIPQLPWVIIRYPDAADSDGPAWSGPLDKEALHNLLDSPARKEISKRLLKGESTVWLFLESGDKAKDDEAVSKLQAHLQKLEKTLKLPELSDTPKDKLLRDDLPLKLSFSVLRLARTDPNEKLFVRMLLYMEKDLAQSPEPILFPVFGRGMALYALVGKGITEGNISDAAVFLTGACSCEVKRLNPGVDLLMTVDWDGELAGAISPPPELPLVGFLPQAVPQTHDHEPSTPVFCGTGEDGSQFVLIRNISIVLGGGLVLVVVATLILMKK